MEFKSEIHQPLSNNELARSMIQMARSPNLKEGQQASTKKGSQFPNGYANQKFFNRYARSQYILAGSVTANLVLIIVYFELSIHKNELCTWLLYMSSVFQFFCIFALIVNYKVFNQYKLQQNHHHQLKKPFEIICYSLILLIKPYPMLQNYTFSFQNELFFEVHKVNDVLCIFSLLEIFLIVPSLFISSKFQSLRSQRISQMYGFTSSYIYALKCWFKENSPIAIASSFFIWFFVCTIAIRIAQYSSNPILESFQNSVWLTFITMSTAGLGDLKPVTNLGYVVNTLSMYSGVIISSIAVMLLRNVFSLNSRQKRTLTILKSLEEKQQLKVVACQYIRESLWRMWTNRKNREYGFKMNPTLKERNLREQFKTLRRQTQKMNFHNSIKDQFKHNFAKVYGYIENLNENQDALIQYFQSRRC